MVGTGAGVPVVDTGLAAAFDGVTVDVTFRGRAAEEGGAIATQSVVSCFTCRSMSTTKSITKICTYKL